MNSREIQILKALLQSLDQLDGAPAYETILHTGVGMKVQPEPTHAEFSAALKHADAEGYVTGLPSKVTRVNKWTISDKGRLALTEL